jgi:hypothetical protein
MPSSVIILRVLVGVMLFAAAVCLFGFILGKHADNRADDPVDVVEYMLLRRSKGIPVPEEDGTRREDGILDDTPLDGLLPNTDIPADPRSEGRKQLYSVDSDPGFPPDGIKLGSFTAKLFFENQRRYSDVNLELVERYDAVYLAGAGMCEIVQSNYVLLKPCIFREELVADLSRRSRSIYELEILRSLSFFVAIPFERYSRHITSTHGCGSLTDFRMSVQYLRRMREGYISLRLPFSVSETDAVGDLKANAARPCKGEDVFFEPEQLIKMLAIIDEQRVLHGKGVF